MQDGREGELRAKFRAWSCCRSLHTSRGPCYWSLFPTHCLCLSLGTTGASRPARPSWDLCSGERQGPSPLPPRGWALLCCGLLSAGAGGRGEQFAPTLAFLGQPLLPPEISLTAGGESEGLWRGLEPSQALSPVQEAPALPVEPGVGGMVPGTQHLPLALWSSFFPLPSPLTTLLPFVQGQKGDQGATGERGLAGFPGEPGPPGHPGPPVRPHLSTHSPRERARWPCWLSAALHVRGLRGRRGCLHGKGSVELV